MTVQSPAEMLIQHFASNSSTSVFCQPVNRQWCNWTWKDIQRDINCIIKGLRELGLQPGDKVSIFGKNSAEWIIADWSILLAGMISVPIYPTANAKTIKYVAQHADIKAVFIGKLDNPDIVDTAFATKLPQIALPYESARGNISWREWLRQPSSDVNYSPAEVHELMSLMYTSGSTGNPKGVELTHYAYGVASKNGIQALHMGNGDRLISYLPLAHIAERVIAEGVLLYSQEVTMYFSESLDTFVEDLQTAQPTIFFSVPRLWARFLSNIHQSIPENKLNRLLSIPLINSLLRRKIKAKLGFSKTRVWITAAAPISKDILKAYEKLGIRVSEAWGMTETTGGICVNYPYQTELAGTIGHPTHLSEIRISPEGEIQVRGDSIFKRYHKNPDATKESFTSDGWFKTGDHGKQLTSGAFQIVGRLKEEFKTTGGKYVAPAPLETRLIACEEIELACVMGGNHPQPFGVVVLAEQLPGDINEQTRQNIQMYLEQLNRSVESHQRLSHIIVASEPWTVENNALTPTMKVRRAEIESRFNAYPTYKDKAKLVVWQEELAG